MGLSRGKRKCLRHGLRSRESRVAVNVQHIAECRSTTSCQNHSIESIVTRILGFTDRSRRTKKAIDQGGTVTDFRMRTIFRIFKVRTRTKSDSLKYLTVYGRTESKDISTQICDSRM